MFEKICGRVAFPNVILATTMWNAVNKAVGSYREEKLTTLYWKSMLAAQSRTARFNYTYESAWEIIGKFAGMNCILQLQEEMVDQGMELEETAAGSTLSRFQDKLLTNPDETTGKLEPRLWDISCSDEFGTGPLVSQETLTTRREVDRSVEAEQMLPQRSEVCIAPSLNPDRHSSPSSHLHSLPLPTLPPSNRYSLSSHLHTLLPTRVFYSPPTRLSSLRLISHRRQNTSPPSQRHASSTYRQPQSDSSAGEPSRPEHPEGLELIHPTELKIHVNTVTNTHIETLT